MTRASTGTATDTGDGAAASPAVAAVAVVGSVQPFSPIEPWIHKKMDREVRARLEAGFDLAVQRVREVDSCRDLFARLGQDGIEMLRTGLYLPVANYRQELVVCGRNPSANSRCAENLSYTKVGGTPTWICRHFARISTEAAAVTILHEALHHAGLTEWPADRLGLSSVQITEMVKSECGFKRDSQTAAGRSARP